MLDIVISQKLKRIKIYYGQTFQIDLIRKFCIYIEIKESFR